MTESMTCSTARAEPLNPVTVNKLLDQMVDFMRHTGKPLDHIELTREQYNQLRNDPTVPSYTHDTGHYESVMGVRISIKEE